MFGKLEKQYQLDIMRARQEEPNIDQGKNIFVQNWKTIQNKVCKEWNYCEKRKEFSDENKLLISIIALAMGGTDWHVRTATVADPRILRLIRKWLKAGVTVETN